MFPLYRSNGKHGSIGLAMVFFMIAILGIIFYFNDYSKPPDTQTVQVPDDTVSFRISQPPLSENHRSTVSGYIIRSILVMGLMLGLLYLGLRMYRYKFKQKRTGFSGIHILGRHYLNPKQYIIIVEWGQRQFLLGVTDNQITKLAEQEILEEMPENLPDTTHRMKSEGLV